MLKRTVFYQVMGSVLGIFISFALASDYVGSYEMMPLHDGRSPTSSLYYYEDTEPGSGGGGYFYSYRIFL